MDNTNPNFIEESLFPRNAATYWSMFLTLECGAVLLSSMVVLPLNLPNWGDTVFFGYGIAALLLAPLCLIFARTQLDYLQARSGRIVFDGKNVLIYSTKDTKAKPQYVAQLTECRWFIGSRTWSTVPTDVVEQITPFGGERFLMIEFPERIKMPKVFVANQGMGSPDPVIVAVGHDPQTRQRWEDIFYQLGVERNEQRETVSSPLSETFCSYLFLFFVVVSFILFLWISRGAEWALHSLDVPINIVSGISWSLFLIGGIAGTFFSNTVILFYQSRQVVKRPVLASDFTWRPVILGIILPIVFLLFYVIISLPNELRWPLETQVAAIATSLLLGLITSLLIRPLVRRIRENTEKELV